MTPCVRPEPDVERSAVLNDRDIFSHLCYRNFAHMETIPFIQSVQRVTYLNGISTKSIVEQLLENGDSFSTGVLWKWYKNLNFIRGSSIETKFHKKKLKNQINELPNF